MIYLSFQFIIVTRYLDNYFVIKQNVFLLLILRFINYASNVILIIPVSLVVKGVFLFK